MTAAGPSKRVKYSAVLLHPGKAEDGCRNQVETALSRSIARRTDTLWSIPQMGTSAALCHLAKTQVCVWPALNRPKQPPPPKPPSYYPNPSYMSSNPLVEPTPSQDRHKVKEQNFHNCCAGVSQPLPYTSYTSAIEKWNQSRCKSLYCLLILHNYRDQMWYLTTLICAARLFSFPDIWSLQTISQKWPSTTFIDKVSGFLDFVLSSGCGDVGVGNTGVTWGPPNIQLSARTDRTGLGQSVHV